MAADFPGAPGHNHHHYYHYYHHPAGCSGNYSLRFNFAGTSAARELKYSCSWGGFGL